MHGFAQAVSKAMFADLQCQRLENLSFRAFSEPPLLDSSLLFHPSSTFLGFFFVLKSCTV